MFTFKKLFNKITESSDSTYSIEKIDETKTLIKFNSNTKNWDFYYNHDLFDERGVLQNNSLIKNSFDNEFEIYQWIKKDGDYVFKGDIICIIRYLPYTNIHGYYRVAILPPIESPENGFLKILKQEDDQIIKGSNICQIESGEKPEESYLPNESISYYYFNKYEIPVNIREQRTLIGQFGILVKHYEQDKIHLLDWLVDDRTFVQEGDSIAIVGAIYDEKPIFKFTLKAKVSGFIYQILPSFYSYPIYQDTLLSCFFKTSTDLYDFIYFNQPNIIDDDFSNKKVIKWDIIGGHTLPFDSSDQTYNIGAVIVNSVNDKFNLMFSLENHNSKDYIVFKYFNKQYKLSPNDEIQFMYDDGLIDKFQIIENPTKISSPWNGLYETKIPITQNELKNIKEKNFSKWKIQFVNSTEFILGGNSNERVNGELLQIIIKDFANHYSNLVSTEVTDHKPLYERNQNDLSYQTSELCHVYLMHDTTNNYYKIGISIKPEYREKTLQGDKPTIELICSKEYPDRGIAKSIENALHSNFSVKRIRGEWFELNQSEVQKIIETLK